MPSETTPRVAPSAAASAPSCTTNEFSLSVPWQPSHAAQQRAWREHSSRRDNLVSQWELRGALDAPRLLSALDQLHANNESLRLTVQASDTGPVSRLAAPQVHQLVDLSKSEDPAAAFRQRVRQAAALSFDLAVSSSQSQLLRLGPEHHVWLLVQHRLTSDCQSQRLLVQQLASGYLQEKNAPPTRACTYAEQLTFHQTYLQSQQRLADTQFFDSRIKRTIEPHRFYNSHPDIASEVAPLVRQAELNAQQLNALKALLGRSEQQGDRELAVFFQTVLLATLRRIGGSREQALGVALRDTSPAPGPCLGNFTHWAALWVELEDADSFASLAERVREDYGTLLEHRRVHVQAPASSDGSTFEVCCSVFREAPGPLESLISSQTLGGGGRWAVEASEPPAVTLQVVLSADGDCCRLSFEFDAQRFSVDDTQRFVGHTTQLVECALRDRDQNILTAPLLSAEERAQLLELNPSAVPVGPDVIEGFEAQALRRASKRALLFGKESLTYLQLNARANRLARALRAQGVGPDDWIAIALERGVELVVTLLACLKLGATYVPLDPSHPASRNSLVLEVATPKALVTDRHADSELKELSQCSCLLVEELLEQCPALDADSEQNVKPAGTGEDRLAYVIFTSGSTGKPKGVQVPRATLANFLTSMQQEPGFKQTDSLLSLTTISFDIAALELFLPLVSGGWLEIADRMFALDPRALIKRLDSGDFTLLQATPATWRMLIEAGWSGSDGLKALCGGEALPPALAQQLCQRTAELWNMYGPTETTIWSTLERVLPKKKGISIGHPVANTQVYILDEKAALLPRGVVGELVIGGLGVARGYAGLPDLTAEKFLSDPFNPLAGARMYRTGDLGRWLADGTLECLGRVDFQVKIRGFRIELGEIETAIAKQGSLPEALVVAREVSVGNLDLVAYGKASSDFDPGALRDYLNQCLPGYMVPAFFVALDSWPLTHNGKIDRKALPLPQEGSRAGKPKNVEPLATQLERRIATIWCETLQVPSVGRNEDLFASGGSSLTAVRLLLNLAEMPEGEISLGVFLKDPTVRGVASAMQSNDDEERAVIVELNQTTVEESAAKPLFCICGVHLYSEIAHAMPERPVLGVYLPLERLLMGLGKAESEPLPTMEEVAASYIEAVIEQQPEGPYFLSGLSFGGVVAFEMARQLKERGETVELLALFDSILPVARSFKRIAWARDHALRGREQGLGYVLNRPGVRQRVDRVLALPGRAKAWLGGARPESEQTAQPPPPNSRAVEEQQWLDRRGEQVRVFDLITDDYEPRMKPIAGDATFFRALGDEERAGTCIEGDGGWRRWLGGKVEVHRLRGDHMGILQGESAKKIASILRSTLQTKIDS